MPGTEPRDGTRARGDKLLEWIHFNIDLGATIPGGFERRSVVIRQHGFRAALHRIVGRHARRKR